MKISNLPLATNLSGAELVPIVQDGQTKRGSIGDLAQAATAAPVAAAQAAAVLAEAVGGPAYASTAAGLAATPGGKMFALDQGDGTVSIWLNNAGVAVFQRRLATSAALAGAGGAALIGVDGGGTVQDVVGPDGRRLSALIARTAAGLGGMHCYGVDSLSAGATLSGAPAPQSWRYLYEGAMRAAIGYGGPGYQPNSYAWSVDAGASYAFAGGAAEFILSDGSANAAAYAPYAPSGHGIILPGSTAYFNWTPEAQWTRARVWYLKGPTLGALSWFILSAGSGSAATIDCYAATWQLAWFEVNNANTTSQGLAIYGAAGATNHTGPAVVFGTDWIYDASKFRPGPLAQGGRTLQAVAAQNSAARQLFFSVSAPAVCWLDGGMNDRAARTAAQHQADLSAILSDIKTASPATQSIVVQSLDPSDASANAFWTFTAAKIAAAKACGAAYLDDRLALGLPTYAAANGAGMMLDGVHPNGIANRAKAQKRALFLGAGLTAPDPGKLAYAGGAGAVATYRGSLSGKNGIQSAAPVSAVTGASATMSGTTLSVTVAPTSGAFAVGQLVTGPGIPTGTIIRALGTGTGGTGTYTVSTSATIGAAVAITGHTLTRTLLWKIGLINGSPQAAFKFRYVVNRYGASSTNVQECWIMAFNTTVYNAVTQVQAGTPTTVFSSTAGDGLTAQYVVDYTISGGKLEVGITMVSLTYVGLISAEATYTFNNPGLIAGISVIEN